MVLYASPFDIATANAFDVLGHSRTTRPRHCASVAHVSPSKSRCTTVEPSYSIESHQGGSVVEVELPGVPKDSVALDVKDRTLTVSGVRQMKQDTVPAGCTERNSAITGTDPRVEEGTGNDPGPENAKRVNAEAARLSRAEADAAAKEDDIPPEPVSAKMTYEVEFTLPSSADAENVTAEFRDRLLTILIPRKAPVSHNISIKLS